MVKVLNPKSKMKTVLITGSNGGIGKDLCKTLFQNGYKVIATDMINDKNHFEYKFIKADLLHLVEDEIQMRIFKEKVKETLDQDELYAIINNAAIQIHKDFEALSLQDWKYTMDINFFAPLVLSKLFLDELNTSNGTIVNISSIHSSLTKKGFSAYATSKAALRGLTNSMSVELGGNIRVNAVEPAAIDTAMLKQGFDDSVNTIDKLSNYHPTGCIGEPQDVSQAVLFLLNPLNKFLNGSIIKVTGGINNCLHDPN